MARRRQAAAGAAIGTRAKGKPAGRPEGRKRDSNGSGAKGKKDQPEFVRAGRLSEASDEPEPFTDFTEISEPKKRLFLQALAVTPRHGKAAKMAGISAKTAYNWRHDPDPAWQAQLQVAERLGLMRAESELWRQGLEGVEVPVFQGGRLVGTKREFYPQLSMFMMKGNWREKYGEQTKHEHAGTVAHAHLHAYADLSKLDDVEVRRLFVNSKRVLDGEVVAEQPALPAAEPTPEERYAEVLRKRNGGTE